MVAKRSRYHRSPQSIHNRHSPRWSPNRSGRPPDRVAIPPERFAALFLPSWRDPIASDRNRFSLWALLWTWLEALGTSRP
jgi:hypothetical protein